MIHATALGNFQHRMVKDSVKDDSQDWMNKHGSAGPGYDWQVVPREILTQQLR